MLASFVYLPVHIIKWAPKSFFFLGDLAMEMDRTHEGRQKPNPGFSTISVIFDEVALYSLHLSS